MSKTRREKCEQRLESMRATRKPYEADWEEVSRLALPTRSDIIANCVGNGTRTTNRKRAANTGSYTSKGFRASRILTAGMTSGLSSPSRPWFKLKTPNPDLNEYQPVKEWLAIAERLTYDFFASTNFYNAVKIGYCELGCFGTEAAVMMDHPEYGMVTHALTAGEYWIANDDGLIADTLYRRSYLSVHQIVQMFVQGGGWGVVSKAVKDAYDKGNYSMIVPVMHAIERNSDRDPTKIDNRNMPYRSVYWEEGQSDKKVLLREGGFDTKPFYAPRWIETGGDFTYGDGPGYAALPDLRELHLASKRRGRNIDILNRPPMGIPSNMAGAYLSLDPGSLNFGSPADIGMIKPLFNPDYNAAQVIREEVDDKQRDVLECFYADLFMAISEMEGVQPRNQEELLLRNEEKLTQLGPVVERVNVEKLEVAIDRAFNIQSKMGRLPPAPEELQGMVLRVDFISTLAQAQKAARLGDIQRTAQFVGFLAAAYPAAADKFDSDQAIDEFANGSGTPPSIIRTDEVVAQIRADRAKQEQAAQAAQMAPALQQSAQAAELLSRTDVGGQSLLERAVGQ